MESLMSWCADCGRDRVFELVPETDGAEYVCRGCDAAFCLGDLPVDAARVTYAA